MLRESRAFSGFSVDDISKARDFCANTLGDGNGPDIALFKDPAGNILAVLSEGP